MKFLRNWITSHYSEDLLACCRAEFKGAERVEVVLRQPGSPVARSPEQHSVPQAARRSFGTRPPRSGAAHYPGPRRHPAARRPHHVGGFEGSPLDPRYTFDELRRRRVQSHGPRRRHPGRGDDPLARAPASILSTFTPRLVSARRTFCTPSLGR